MDDPLVKTIVFTKNLYFNGEVYNNSTFATIFSACFGREEE